MWRRLVRSYQTTQSLARVVDRCECQPLYMQPFFYRLRQNRALDLDKVIDIKQEIIQSHKNEYITIFDTLTANEIKPLSLSPKRRISHSECHV